jgi:rhodanese-related sulfurtransferase
MNIIFISILALTGIFGAQSCAVKKTTTQSETETLSSTENIETTEQTTPTVKNIIGADVATIVKGKQAIILDVRTPDEMNNGVIEGASLFINLYGGTFDQELAKLDKTKTYIVYCHSGNRSAKAASIMLSKGFTSIYNLQGGITDWKGKVVKKP